MRRIDWTTAFRRDLKREKKGQHKKTVEALVFGVVLLLANDKPLPEANRDHALIGEWKDHRDCHIKPDLVLIYRLPDTTTLRLVRLGSHSALFG